MKRCNPRYQVQRTAKGDWAVLDTHKVQFVVMGLPDSFAAHDRCARLNNLI